MPSHMTRSAKSVPKGTAPDDFWPQMNMLRTKKMVKTMPGKSMAVHRAFDRQRVNLNMRKRRADV